MEQVFFDNWQSILRSLIITILAYLGMVLMLRLSKKRTLSKMNAYDFVITISLGSALATVALNKQVALTDGLLIFFLLIFLQFCITWLSVRYDKVKYLFTNRPTLLLYKGKLLHEVLKKQRVPIEEIHLAARQKGIAYLKDIDAVVLESNGQMSVITSIAPSEDDALQSIENYPRLMNEKRG